MQNHKEFKDVLFEYRIRKNISQNHLAGSVFCDSSYISRLESGSRTPHFSMVVELADVLQLSGWERVYFFASSNYIEQPLTKEQAMLVAKIQEENVQQRDIDLIDFVMDRYKLT